MDKKKVLFITLGVIISVAFIYSVILAVNKKNSSTNNSSSITTSGETATNISSQYDNVNYGSETRIEANTITSGGTYTIEGESDPIVINTDDDVKLVLNGVTITNNSGPAIYVENAKTVSIEIKGENIITSKTTEELDGAIYSTDDLIIYGSGKLTVNSNYDGIVSKDTLVIKSGTYVITTDDDGIRGKDSVAITDGTFTINSKGDGIKATNEEDTEMGYLAIDGGTFNITSVGDGLQAETEVLLTGGNYTIKTTGTDSSKAIKAGTTLRIDNGTYNINASDDGIHSDGNLVINNGTFNITSKDDAIHADVKVEINDGTFTINGAEGIEATYVQINGGDITIKATDDGINAGAKSDLYTPTIEINGGTITIDMGQGDTDAIDSNGNIIVNGGTINITAQSVFDFDGKAEYNGGTITANGQKLTSIQSSMMGGGMQGGQRGR